MIGSLFEAAISAVNSERAGDLFLYACAVALIVFFIVRRVYLSECASAPMFFCFLFPNGLAGSCFLAILC